MYDVFYERDYAREESMKQLYFTVTSSRINLEVCPVRRPRYPSIKLLKVRFYFSKLSRHGLNKHVPIIGHALDYVLLGYTSE